MKNRRFILVKAIRIACGAALGLSSSLSGTSALAQEPREIEEIYVTGSRIARGSDFENPSPVVSFSKEELEKTGYSTLQQMLEKQPFAGNGTFSTRGNNQDSTANGAAAISLRGLGADATLVLVNGRRVAVSPFAESVTTSFVDINAIPVAAIERLEVLKDGASAVYGSDAVAGVVNVVLRKDFDGAEVSASYGSTTESGMDETRLSGIWGVNGEDSNLTVILDYFNNSTLMNKERGSLGSADQSPRGGIDNRSSRSFPGSFVLDDGDPLTDPVAVVDPACPADRADGANCIYDYGPWNLLTPESERSGFMLLGRQGLGENLEFFTEIGVQHNNSIAQGAPTPLDGDAGLTVPTTHPNNPFPGATSIAIRRLRTVDAGPRAFDLTSDNLRLVLGLRGKINDFDWEVSGQRARGKSEQTGSRSQGWVRTDLLQQQIDLGNYNPFGATYNSPEVIDSITTSLVRRGTSDLTAYDAQLSGDLFDIAAGTVRVAAGLEYREESVEDIPDDQFQRGLIFGTEAIAASGSRDITSAYVEFAVPVLQNLELSLAGRYDDYSDFGDTTNPKLAMRWSPIESIAVRASWGTGFRAPSLAQIGLGPSQESSFFLDAPGCADNPAYCASTDYTVTYTGNPDLDAEESDSFNFGIGWKPSDALQFSVDYWDITQDDKIDKDQPGPLVANFCTVQDSPVCVRNPPLAGDTLGELSTVFATFANAGKQSVNGIDLSAFYSLDLGGGSLGLSLDYSHLLEFKRALPAADGSGFEEKDVTGKYEYPEDRFVLTGDWQLADWGVNAAVNYIGGFDDLNGTPDYFDSTRSVDSFVTLNLQARYTGFENIELVLGAENALDEEPPFAIGDGDTDLYGYVSSQHDPRGRFIYGRMTFNF